MECIRFLYSLVHSLVAAFTRVWQCCRAEYDHCHICVAAWWCRRLDLGWEFLSLARLTRRTMTSYSQTPISADTGPASRESSQPSPGLCSYSNIHCSYECMTPEISLMFFFRPTILSNLRSKFQVPERLLIGECIYRSTHFIPALHMIIMQMGMLIAYRFDGCSQM